ncbi:carboxyl-terminal processing protease [Thermoflexales bacterium]|nr:carboxyl-terminal processing protease [Thermoflexales bacterium]
MRIRSKESDQAMKTNRILISILALVLVAAVATSGYMAGFANGQTTQAASVVVPEIKAPVLMPAATATPEKSATSGDNDAQSATSPDKSLETFWEAYEILQREYYGDDLATGKDLEYNAIRGLIFGLEDQFTSFVSPEAARLIDEDATGSFSGIGAYVQLNQQRALQITRVFQGSPAEQAGLKAGDLIIEVDGESLVGGDLSEQVAKVRGPEGSIATFTVVREGEDKPLKVDITRATIEIKLVESKMLANNVAYVALSKFDSSTTARQLQAAIQDLLEQRPVGLIFDLRDNPGGFLDQSVDVADLFLNAGVVLYERTKDGTEQVFRSDDDGLAQDIPLVVLINGGSASAAEIVAGAIQDRGRGELIGETTFGKGSVQQINRLGDGSQLRVTIARWFTPDNRGIHGEGIEPDLTVERGDDPQVDPQLDRAVEYLLTGK